jgi:hypothetical protein
MDPNRFDMFARMIGAKTSRRRALGLAAGLTAGVATIGGQAAAAQTGTPTPHRMEDFPAFLFVQTFSSGTWTPSDEEGVYQLSLSGISAGTVAFSDRPDRIVSLVPTDQFLNNLGFTPVNPPNAALVAMRADSPEQEVLVIELFSPTYDAETGTLTYLARVLEDYGAEGLATLAAQQTDYQLPETFADGSLFIDDCPDGGAVCYQILNGEKVIVGNLDDVGCCYDWGAGNCRACNDDATSWYYGQLCADRFPDKCSYADDSWDCFADEIVCEGIL